MSIKDDYPRVEPGRLEKCADEMGRAGWMSKTNEETVPRKDLSAKFKENGIR